MRITGSVTEFNPFHSGHAHFLKSLKEQGAEAVICVMSGTFVQRGEPALMFPGARAAAAVLGGADLVVELPAAWAMSRAQTFADGGVGLIRACGICDSIGFGSECGDIEKIKKASGAERCEGFSAELHRLLDSGLPFAAARERAAGLVCPGSGEVLSLPNDTLACEYLKAASDMGAGLEPICIKREGARHDCAGGGESASAGEIRKILRSGGDASRFVPDFSERIIREETAAGRAPSRPELLDRAVLFRMRTAGAGEIGEAPDVSEGLAERIAAAAQTASCTDELFDLVKTKRYSHARIRRIVMSTLLGMTARDCEGLPPYIRVLAFNSRGRELLRMMKKTAEVPVIMKYSDVKNLNERGKSCFALQCRAADIFSLCFPCAGACGSEQKFTPIFLP